MVKISFIGSGDVSCTTAFASALKLGDILEEVVLIDIRENWAKGNAIDLQQACIINNTKTKFIGTAKYENIVGSDVIIITAGKADKGGNSNREQLLAENKKIIKNVADELKKYITTDEKQPFIIMVSNPVDLILNYFIKIGNFNKKKTVGSGNWLDTARFKDMISREINIEASKINTFAIAQHGAKIVYLISKTDACGKPLKEYGLTDDKIREIQDKATNGSQEIIGLLTTKSTTYGPALSILDLIQSYVLDRKQLLVASVYLSGEYGIEEYTLGVPIILGKNGIEEIKLFDLSTDEKEDYKNSYEFVLSLEI